MKKKLFRLHWPTTHMPFGAPHLIRICVKWVSYVWGLGAFECFLLPAITLFRFRAIRWQETVNKLLGYAESNFLFIWARAGAFLVCWTYLLHCTSWVIRKAFIKCFFSISQLHHRAVINCERLASINVYSKRLIWGAWIRFRESLCRSWTIIHRRTRLPTTQMFLRSSAATSRMHHKSKVNKRVKWGIGIIYQASVAR